MKILKKILEKLVSQPGNQSNLIYLYYQCNRCKEVFELLLRKSYDIQTVYDDHADFTYLYNKELRDPKCFNEVKIRVGFDRNYNIIHKEIHGGKFLTREEFCSLKTKS